MNDQGTCEDSCADLVPIERHPVSIMRSFSDREIEDEYFRRRMACRNEDDLKAQVMARWQPL